MAQTFNSLEDMHNSLSGARPGSGTGQVALSTVISREQFDKRYPAKTILNAYAAAKKGKGDSGKDAVDSLNMLERQLEGTHVVTPSRIPVISRYWDGLQYQSNGLKIAQRIRDRRKAKFIAAAAVCGTAVLGVVGFKTYSALSAHDAPVVSSPEIAGTTANLGANTQDFVKDANSGTLRCSLASLPATTLSANEAAKGAPAGPMAAMDRVAHPDTSKGFVNFEQLPEQIANEFWVEIGQGNKLSAAAITNPSAGLTYKFPNECALIPPKQ